MPRNKNRIYMAFYSRSQNDDYHMAVLVSPKNPNPDDINTWRLHVMNRPNPGCQTHQEWKYEPLQVIGRTGRLLSLVLLDKTEKSGEEVSEMLRNVKVLQDDTSWNCKSWTFSAIEYLQDQGIVRALPMSLDNLYDIGSKMARDFATISEKRKIFSVPTFNSAGEAIKSEIG